MTPKRIIWHHTGDASPGAQFDKINAYHKSRGFPLSSLGYFVGYHYLIERDGTLRQARSLEEMGAHDQAENLNSLGIALAGNFDIERPSEAQTIKATKSLGEIMAAKSIPITRIEPHRRDDETSCPGRLLGDDWLTKEYLRRHANPLVQQFLAIGEEKGFL